VEEGRRMRRGSRTLVQNFMVCNYGSNLFIDDDYKEGGGKKGRREGRTRKKLNNFLEFQ
jgi:hypothetical protein